MFSLSHFALSFAANMFSLVILYDLCLLLAQFVIKSYGWTAAAAGPCRTEFGKGRIEKIASKIFVLLRAYPLQQKHFY
jgi:hypothetical protein